MYTTAITTLNKIIFTMVEKGTYKRKGRVVTYRDLVKKLNNDNWVAKKGNGNACSEVHCCLTYIHQKRSLNEVVKKKVAMRGLHCLVANKESMLRCPRKIEERQWKGDVNAYKKSEDSQCRKSSGEWVCPECSTIPDPCKATSL